VAARTRGNQCGDHVSKLQLELLSEALAEPKEITNAAG
jgi:hypothetical protein